MVVEALENASLNRIRVLPPEVADRIAAGEVIERPASVVKELVENSLDAGARRIEVELRRGGRELIRVVDDGVGVAAADVDQLFRRHATSKIARFDDIVAVATLGFRGEALASLALVAAVTVTTRSISEAVGARVAIETAGPIRRVRWAREPGTTVEARRLFQATPARLKFLRETRAETSAAVQTLRRLALARPECALTLSVDGRRLWRTTGSGSARTVMAELFGAELAATLLELRHARGRDLAISGVLAGPTWARVDRNRLTIVVNGRPVEAPALVSAVEAAARGRLPPGRRPVGVVALTIPAVDVDVNTHPSKAQVKIRRELEVAVELGAAVEAMFDAARPTTPADSPPPDWQYALPESRQRRACGQNNVADALPERYAGDVPTGVNRHQLVSAAEIRELRLLAQVRESLLLAEGGAGLYIIDQHRAHERVIYERLRAEDANAATQWLLEPIIVEVRPGESATLNDRLEALAELGFHCESFGGRAFLIRGAPVGGGGVDTQFDVEAALREAASEDGDWRDRLLVSVACRAALRKGRAMTVSDQAGLLAQLAECEHPGICPHGSPIVLRLAHRDIERYFGW